MGYYGMFVCTLLFVGSKSYVVAQPRTPLDFFPIQDLSDATSPPAGSWLSRSLRNSRWKSREKRHDSHYDDTGIAQTLEGTINLPCLKPLVSCG